MSIIEILAIEFFVLLMLFIIAVIYFIWYYRNLKFLEDDVWWDELIESLGKKDESEK